MIKDKTCIDFHAHPVTDSFRKAMAELGIDPMEEDGFPLPPWSAEEHLASMGMMETVDAKAEFERLYFNIAGDPEPVQLKMLRMVAAEDRIVYGSDFPHAPARVILGKKRHFDANTDYDGIRERVYSENALRLLKGEET